MWLRAGCVFLLLFSATVLPQLRPAPVHAAPPSVTPPLTDTLEALESYRTEHRFQAALEKLTDLKARHPENKAVLWRRALILTDLGKRADSDDQTISYYRQALDDANAALDADSSTAWPHAIKALVEGRLCLNVGKRERARRSESLKHHAEHALALDSTLALGHHMLGR